MRFLLLPAGVSLVVLLGLLIDAQSRTPVRRPAARSEPARIFAPGRIEGTTPEIELRPQVAGRIVEIRVEEGQRVRKGDVLLRLDDEQCRHQVAMAAAELALAEAQLERLVHGARPQQRTEAAALHQAKLAELERAELSWGRIDDLRQARAVSQQEADNKRTLVTSLKAEVEAAKARLELLEAPARPDEVEMDKARIEAAKAQLQLANVGLEWTNLRASRDGQILRVGVEAGELTGPNAAEASVMMADTSRFYVRVYVEEQDAPRMMVGVTATIVADGLPGEELKGRVVRLSPRMSRKELFSDDPSEHQDVKTREVWIELLAQGTEENLGYQMAGSAGLVVGLPVDVIIDPDSVLSDSPKPPESEVSGHEATPAPLTSTPGATSIPSTMNSAAASPPSQTLSRLELVRAAILAPSPDNNQPWQFVPEGDRLLVYLDPHGPTHRLRDRVARTGVIPLAMTHALLSGGDTGDRPVECLAAGAHGCVLEVSSLKKLEVAVRADDLLVLVVTPTSAVDREFPFPCSHRPLIPCSSRELGSSPCPCGSLTGGREASLRFPWWPRFPTMLCTDCVECAECLVARVVDRSALFIITWAKTSAQLLFHPFSAGGIRRRPADASWAATGVCSPCINAALSPHSPNRLRSACVRRSIDSCRAQTKRGASFSDRRLGNTQPRPAARNRRGIAQSTPNWRSER